MAKYNKTLIVLAVLVLIVLSLVLLAGAMHQPVRDEEHMHCTIGVLQSRGQMVYRDFSYPFRPPYLPLFYAGLFKLLPTTHYLLYGRLFSVLCVIAASVCIVGIFRRVFAGDSAAGTAFGLAAAVLYVFNPFVYNMSGLACHQNPAILFVVMAFWLFICIDPVRRPPYAIVAGIGFLVTLAACTQLIMVVMPGLFGVMLLARFAGPLRQRLKNTLPFVCAMAVVLIWPVRTLFASPKAFITNLLSMPIVYMPVVFSKGMFFRKLELCATLLTVNGSILVIIIAAFLYLAVFRHRDKLIITERANSLLAVLMVLVVFLLVVICLPEIRRVYFAEVVPFLLISFAYPLVHLKKMADAGIRNRAFRTSSIIIIACACSAVGCRSFTLTRIASLLKPQTWIPIGVHETAVDIAAASTSPKPVATMAPLYALEGGLSIHPELAAGPIAYWFAQAMSPDQVKAARTITKQELEQRIKDSPPSIVILNGPNGRAVDEPILRIAKYNWPEQQYDKELWERREYPIGIIAYIRRDEYYTPAKTQTAKLSARKRQRKQ